jgi:hypothetical protein
MAKKKITFVIDGFTPDTLPIGRLAEYLKNFAALVGAENDVHFERVGKGSAALISNAPETLIPQVRGRIQTAPLGGGSPEAVRAFTTLKAMLYQDKTTGRIKEEKRKILEFPRPEIADFGTVSEEGELEGIVIRIGGKDETIHVHILDGEQVHICVTNRTIAKELRDYLLEFDRPIRVFGKGKWTRDENGTWALNEFRIASHDTLNGDDLLLVLEKLRRIPGSRWGKINDPLAELDRIRKGPSDKVQ